MRNLSIVFGALLFLLVSGRAEDSAAQAVPSVVQFEIKVYEAEGVANRTVGYDWYSSQALLGSPQASAAPTTNAQIGTLTGILSDPQFRAVVGALESDEKNTRLLARSAVATISGKPLELQRPDGWRFQLLPTVDPKSGRMTTLVQVRQTKGNYAGFHLNTHVIMGHGRGAIFSDSAPKPGKSGKRLLIVIVPRIESVSSE